MANNSAGYLSIQTPSTYASRPPVPFQQPALMTTFSYSPSRELLLRSSDRHNEALRFYRQPVPGSDLNFGFERCIFREEKVEGLDALLRAVLEIVASDIERDRLLGSSQLFTWRGIVVISL